MTAVASASVWEGAPVPSTETRSQLVRSRRAAVRTRALAIWAMASAGARRRFLAGPRECRPDHRPASGERRDAGRGSLIPALAATRARSPRATTPPSSFGMVTPVRGRNGDSIGRSFLAAPFCVPAVDAGGVRVCVFAEDVPDAAVGTGAPHQPRCPARGGGRPRARMDWSRDRTGRHAREDPRGRRNLVKLVLLD